MFFLTFSQIILHSKNKRFNLQIVTNTNISTMQLKKQENKINIKNKLNENHKI